MKNIEERVLGAIKEFVSEGQSFISLDIYCLLGVRIENEDYPIHQQVRDAFIQGVMTNYLSEWTHLKLESGGHANIWRYYLPKAEVKIIPLKQRDDGRVDIAKNALGYLPILENSIEAIIKDGFIELISSDGISHNAGQVFENPSNVRLSKGILNEAGLSGKDLYAKVYANRVEIRGE